MRAGRLRHNCTFYEDTSDDESLDAIWTAVGHLTDWPCNVVPVSGAETFSRNDTQLEATTTHKIETRYSADITTRLQIVDHLGNTHTIESVIDKDGRARQLELKTTRLD